MKIIIDFFKKIIEIILKMLFDKKENSSFITFDGDELITSGGKMFITKGEK